MLCSLDLSEYSCNVWKIFFWEKLDHLKDFSKYLYLAWANKKEKNHHAAKKIQFKCSFIRNTYSIETIFTGLRRKIPADCKGCFLRKYTYQLCRGSLQLILNFLCSTNGANIYIIFDNTCSAICRVYRKLGSTGF